MRELCSELLGQDTSKLLKKTHMLRCAQSSRSNVTKMGIVEGWNDELIPSRPNTPIFPYSNTPFPLCASETFLSSLQTEVFTTAS
jgi:hypothetical protein